MNQNTQCILAETTEGQNQTIIYYVNDFDNPSNIFYQAKTRVKWNGRLSKPCNILHVKARKHTEQRWIQSPRQWPTMHARKLQHGHQDWEHFCAALACADDMALIVHSRQDRQAMLDICHNYSKITTFMFKIKIKKASKRDPDRDKDSFMSRIYIYLKIKCWSSGPGIIKQIRICIIPIVRLQGLHVYILAIYS